MKKSTIGLVGVAGGALAAFLVSGLGLPFASAQSSRNVSNEGNEAWAAPPGNPAW